MGVDQIEARLAAGKVTMKILQDMAFDNHVFAARLARHDLMPVCAGDDAPVTIGDRAVSLAPACETLRAWAGTADTDSVGSTLFASWWDRLEGHKAIWAMPFSATAPNHTPPRFTGGDPPRRALSQIRKTT